MPDASTTLLQGMIQRMNSGDPSARDELIGHACERLGRLTRKMFHDFQRLGRWVEPDDVAQNAAVRLLQALKAAEISSVAEFFRLAACNIRRELIDLARHYFGPEGLGAKHATQRPAEGSDSPPAPAYDRPESTYDAGRLAAWSELHQRIERLPEGERDVFDLLWYQELTQAEAAAVLGISVPTVKRRWLEAKLRLKDTMKDSF